MLKVLEHLLMCHPAERPEYQAYTDAVKELQTDAMHELRRIAIKMPNQVFVRQPSTA
jgi:exportin-5